ncbi:MAG: SulP family inorganic anion transporter [Oligoflexia bacterium]|nr:SulP family inorganic anion transporter [Oligoflexia bacterium]
MAYRIRDRDQARLRTVANRSEKVSGIPAATLVAPIHPRLVPVAVPRSSSTRSPRASLGRFFPLVDLAGYRLHDLPQDLVAAAAVAFLCIPQGIAYAVIAGLPPAMGLYAGAIPAIVASLMRSSRQLITGPTNAVSLLIGTTLLTGVDAPPMVIGVTLALMVGVFQVVAGAMRLGALVDFISGAVVLGFITGAGILIGLGQLPNLTASPGGQGPLYARLAGWFNGLGDANLVSIAIAFGTALAIWGLRRLWPRLPAALLALAAVTTLAAVLDLSQYGLTMLGDLSPIAASLPPLTMPDLSLVRKLTPLAIAITVLCMVESTSMARSIAQRSGHRLDISVEFLGEGLGNLVGSLFGAYPATGSLSRSALNEREGATSRMAGVLSGLMVLAAPLALGPLLDRIPLSALAGLLVVVAVRLIDPPRIKRVLASHNGDRIAFVGTLLACFVLSLEHAVFVGIAISLVNVLRRSRLVAARDLVVDDSGRLREVDTRVPDAPGVPGQHRCRQIHVLNIEGSLFFGAASQLQNAIDNVLDNPDVQVLILRLKRVRDLDVSTLDVLAATAQRMRGQHRDLLLLGMKARTVTYFDRTGLTQVVGTNHIFPSRSDHWFSALADALRWAMSRLEHHDCGGDCPYERWLRRHDREESLAETSVLPAGDQEN